MRVFFIFFLTVLFSFCAEAQVSMNMNFLDRWDVDTLPDANGRYFNDVWGHVDCAGNEYGILGSASRVHFFDLSDPTNISEIASFAGGEVTTWRDMKTYRDRAYAVSDATDEGLMIFDLSNLPDVVTKTYQSNEHFGRSHNIFVDEPNGRLYAVGTNTQSSGVIVFDLSCDPDNPTVLAAVDFPGGGYVHDIFVKDNIAYCSHGWNGFYVWDMNDPTNPVLMASKPTGGYNHSSWLSEDESFVIYAEEVPTGRPLGVMNLSDLDMGIMEIDHTWKAPVITADSNVTPHNPFVRGDLLICSYYEDGVQVFDISDRMNPTKVAYYDTYPSNTSYNGYNGNWGTYPFLPSGIILASDIVNGLFVLEMDTTDMVNIAPPEAQDLSFLDGSEHQVCAGDSLFMELPEGADSYFWYKDDTVLIEKNKSFTKVFEAGNYSVKSWVGACSAAANFSVSVLEYPDVSTFPAGAIEFCEGENFVIEMPDDYTYEWFKDGNIIPGANDNELTIFESGTYYAMVTNEICTTPTTDLVVTANASPELEIVPQGSTTFCEGGFVVIDAVAPDAISYVWIFDGDEIGTSSQITADEEGEYMVIITDELGCTSESLIELEVDAPVIPEIEEDGNILTSTNATSYQWYLNGEIISGATEQNYEVTESGSYFVVTIDGNGCMGVSNILDIIYSSVGNLKNLQTFSVFPNPVNNLLEIQIELSEGADLQMELISVHGKILISQNQFFQQKENITLNVSAFPQGIYFLKIGNESGQAVKKVVKK